MESKYVDQKHFLIHDCKRHHAQDPETPPLILINAKFPVPYAAAHAKSHCEV